MVDEIPGERLQQLRVRGRIRRPKIIERLDEPAPGLAFVGVGGPDDETVFAILRAQFFGDGADAAAERDEPVWRSLITERVGVSS